MNTLRVLILIVTIRCVSSKPIQGGPTQLEKEKKQVKFDLLRKV